jgi:hypothetical protein
METSERVKSAFSIDLFGSTLYRQRFYEDGRPITPIFPHVRQHSLQHRRHTRDTRIQSLDAEAYPIDFYSHSTRLLYDWFPALKVFARMHAWMIGSWLARTSFLGVYTYQYPLQPVHT